MVKPTYLTIILLKQNFLIITSLPPPLYKEICVIDCNSLKLFKMVGNFNYIEELTYKKAIE